MIENHMIGRMQARATALGIGLTMPPEAQVAMFAARAGFDWAFIDLEHTLISPESVATNCAMLRAVGVTPVARIPKAAGGEIARLLDGGAQGIVLPHVDTADEARDFVDQCKYSPAGHRSWGGASPQLGYPTQPSAELLAAGNERTLAIIMIESAQGVENIGAIARTPGLDGILVGNVDLSVDLGEVGHPGGPKTSEAIRAVGRSVNAAGKYFGLAGAPSAAAISALDGVTVNFALAGMDYRLLAAALGNRAAEWREVIG